MAIKRHRKLVDTVGVSENPPTANYQRRPALAQEAKAAQPFRPISHRANPGGARSRRSIESGDTDRRAPFEKTLSFSTLRKVSCSQIRTNRFQPPRHRNSELDRQKQLTHLLPPVKLDCLKQSSLYATGCVEARERDRPRLVSVANRNGISCAGGRERPPIHRTCVWKLKSLFSCSHAARSPEDLHRGILRSRPARNTLSLETTLFPAPGIMFTFLPCRSENYFLSDKRGG